MSPVGSEIHGHDDHAAQLTGDAGNEPTFLSFNVSGGSESYTVEVTWEETAQSNDDFEETVRRHSLVQNLARTFTSESHGHRNGEVFAGPNDPASSLNPNSPSFNARTWARGSG